MLSARSFIIEFLLNYLIEKAERKFQELKAGSKKFAYVVNEMESAINANPALKAKADEIMETLPERIKEIVLAKFGKK